jgi:hypothetical protein
VLHLILDNYTIHSSKIVKAALAEWGGRLRIHFLPPTVPTRIASNTCVTRNHRCRTINKLLTNVRRFLRNAMPFPGSRPSLARAAQA